MKGALNGFKDHDELYWNAIGQRVGGHDRPATVTVDAPTADHAGRRASRARSASTLPCDRRRRTAPTAHFSQTELFPYQGVTVVVAIPKGAVPAAEADPRGALDGRARVRGQRRRPAASRAALLAAARRRLRLPVLPARRATAAYKGGAVDQAFAERDGADEERMPLFEHTETPVEFVPPDDLRPGQVGTLVDFHANPLDVTATIVDLAVRKYLVIEEVPTTSRWQAHDWKLTKLKDADDELKDYERSCSTACSATATRWSSPTSSTSSRAGCARCRSR